MKRERGREVFKEGEESVVYSKAVEMEFSGEFEKKKEKEKKRKEKGF